MSDYTYDAAGNLTFDKVHTYYYDAENRLIQIDGTPGLLHARATARPGITATRVRRTVQPMP
jgi:hypothetical protein